MTTEISVMYGSEKVKQLSTTVIVLIRYTSRLNRIYGLKMKICKCFILSWTNIGNFHFLEVEGCGSETQLQVSANLN